MNKITKRKFCLGRSHCFLRGAILRLAMLFTVFWGSYFVVPEHAMARQLPQFLVILDSSSSMDDKLGYELKYKIVRRAIGKTFPAYIGKLRAGLVVFGNKHQNSCKDITRALPLKTLKKKIFSRTLAYIRPKGKSPIGAALMNALQMASKGKRPLQMLLIADGSDNCRTNVCATANTIARHSPQTKIHVIGLGKNGTTRRLACIAQATNGIFSAVGNSDEMKTALHSILRATLFSQTFATNSPGKQAANALSSSPGADTKPPHTVARYTQPDFLKTIPLPVRSPLRHKKKKEKEKTKPKSRATRPTIDNTPLAAPQNTLQTTAKGNRQRASQTPETPKAPETSVAPKVPEALELTEAPDAKTVAGLPVQWQKITEKPVIISEAGQVLSEQDFSKNQPKPAAKKSFITGALPSSKMIVAQLSPAPQKPVQTKTAPQTTFSGSKPQIEITLPQSLAPVKLSALIKEQGSPIESGLVWRIYQSKKDPSGRYKLIKSVRTPQFDDKLPLGVYLVNLSWGRSHLTEKMDILSTKPFTRQFIMNAGGLRLGARHIDGSLLQANEVNYKIYSDERDQFGKRRLILDNVTPNKTIRLNAGIYHISSLYGTANGLIETDITVEAGKLTEAIINHTASKVTFKLVDKPGGEALAGAVWRITSPDGKLIKDVGGALPTLVLAAGDYLINAQYLGRSFARKVSIQPGAPVHVEIVIQ